MGAIKDLDYLEKEISLSLYGRAIAHPARVKIISRLYENESMCRNIDLSSWLQLSRTAIKNHVDMIKDAELVRIEYYPHHYEIYLNEKGVRFAEMILPATNL